MTVKLSREFASVQEAVSFMNSLADPLCSYVIPRVSQNAFVAKSVAYSTYYVVYYEDERND